MFSVRLHGHHDAGLSSRTKPSAARVRGVIRPNHLSSRATVVESHDNHGRISASLTLLCLSTGHRGLLCRRSCEGHRNSEHRHPLLRRPTPYRRSARRRATVATTKLTFGGCACFETLARSVYRWMRASMAVPEACRRAMYRRWSIASGRRSTNTVIPCDRRQLRSEATTSACPALSSAPEGRRRNVGVVLDSRPGIWTTIAGMTWPKRAAGSPACSWPDVREHLNVPSWGRGGRK